MSARDLIAQLNDLDEHARLEAKKATQVGKALLETVCAFSNEPNLGGGTILLGVEREEGTLFPLYKCSGVPDPDAVQRDLVSQCRSVFNVPISISAEVEEVDGARVVVVGVPEAPPGLKPVFFQSTGLPKGAYRRIGSSDVRCTDEDLAVLFQGRRTEPHDALPLADATLADADPDAVAAYRRERARINPNAEELSLDDAELLTALGCARLDDSAELRLTTAGLVLFGRALSLRRLMPMTRVDYIRVTGRGWVGAGEERYESALELRGPLMTLIGRTQAAISDDLPRAFHLPEGALQRADEPRLPLRVVREAVVNALMHRSYREQQPTQIIRYANRLELRNPGFSLKSEDRLGEPGSEPRNPSVAAVLHDLNFAETKGTGIRAMQRAMEAADLTPPQFESDRDANRFVATFLFHHFLTEQDARWLGQFGDLGLAAEDQKALVYMREAGRIGNRTYRELNRMHPADATQALKRLRETGLIAARDRTSARYYVPAGRLAAAMGPGAPPIGDAIADRSADIEGKRAGIEDSDDAIADGETLARASAFARADLPEGLAMFLDALGRRTEPARVKMAIALLCQWRPMPVRDLTVLLGRSRRYTWDLVQELEAEGVLAPTHPSAPKHPHQAYRTMRPLPGFSPHG